jgi:hypothetical protein
MLHDVGVRFKGITSYRVAGNSQKKSFNIEIDATGPDQRLMGYKTLNLNNASMDPSFIREVLYFNIFRKYAPCPQANFVKLIINGENWGIYVNAQQQNSNLIEEWFGDNDGNRWKVGMIGSQGGFVPFQSLEEWEMGVRWHVMIPPYDWAEIYLRHRHTEISPSLAFKIPSLDAQDAPEVVDPPESVWR